MKLIKYISIVAFFWHTASAFSQNSDIHSVGMVSGGIFYTTNPSIKYGAELKIIDSMGDMHCCARIVTSGSVSEDSNFYDAIENRSVYAYTLSVPHAISKNLEGFGIPNYIDAKKALNSIDAIIDGITFSLSTCTSTEGIHYFARRKYDKKIVVDIYRYTDADLQSNCKDRFMKQ
ncbi:hypothetical protein [Burkholderia sp. SRS-W-2-2016]|uniref:hypothetical protein n=1 Tax=Burkholderia sp. SRS-W-2-2016 TaxID=1926878 RepID=UPI001180DF5C|nr:hypothetical protein [Burkholderia sp. SRS-W-2-2016]